MPRYAAILLAAGESRRFGDQHFKKPFVQLAGRAVWLHSADRFINREDCVQVIVAVARDDWEMFHERYGSNIAILGVEPCVGGANRADSVAAGLEKVHDDIDFVIVHDAARPCLAEKWVNQVCAAAEKSQAAILAAPVTSTLKRVGANGHVAETVDREGLWQAQTPQVFARQLLVDAYAQRSEFIATDDAQLVERIGHPVKVVTGSERNLKITTKDDLRLAEQVLKTLPKPKSGPLHPFADDDLWR